MIQPPHKVAGQLLNQTTPCEKKQQLKKCPVIESSISYCDIFKGLHQTYTTFYHMVFFFTVAGYYRVNYDVKNWKMIIDQLERDHLQIHVINRAQLIDDALNLARVGLLDYELALGVTSYLKNEKEYIPWAAALSNLKYLRNMLQRSAAYGDFKVCFIINSIFFPSRCLTFNGLCWGIPALHRQIGDAPL